MVPQKRSVFSVAGPASQFCLFTGKSLRARFASFQMGTTGRHRQLALEHSRGSCAGLDSTSGCSHMGWRTWLSHLLGIFLPARPALPSSQSALPGSETASARLGTPSTPLPAGQVTGTRRLQPVWNSPPPPRDLDGLPFPG